MHGRARRFAPLRRPLPAARPAVAPTDTAVLQRLLVAEDARGTGRDGIEPLLSALSGSDTLLRRLAVRGLGRFQRPELGRRLVPFLSDPTPAIRAEAANAIAQSVRRIKRSETAIDGERFGTLDAARALSGALAAEADAARRRRAGAVARQAAAARQRGRSRRRGRHARAARAPGDARRGSRALHARPGAKRFTGTLTPPTIALLRRTAVGTRRHRRPPAGAADARGGRAGSTAPPPCAPGRIATTRPAG